MGCVASLGTIVIALSVPREQMESQLEKEARFRQLMAHSSHDSAIDTDSMEWETEIVEFERETVSCLDVFTPFERGVGEDAPLVGFPHFSAVSLGLWLFLPGCVHPFPALVQAGL